MIMDVDRIKRFKLNKNQKGQALIEFMLFLPFILMMYSVTLSISASINGAINQQKITRGYFYYRAMNNSSMPKPRRDSPIYNKFRVFGQQISGWRDQLRGITPLKACYKFRIPFAAGTGGDDCEVGYQNRITQLIRVGTVYGVCAETHVTSGGRILKAIHAGDPRAVIGPDACNLRN